MMAQGLRAYVIFFTSSTISTELELALVLIFFVLSAFFFACLLWNEIHQSAFED